VGFGAVRHEHGTKAESLSQLWRVFSSQLIHIIILMIMGRVETTLMSFSDAAQACVLHGQFVSVDGRITLQELSVK
jgi:hypothetical protein